MLRSKSATQWGAGNLHYSPDRGRPRPQQFYPRHEPRWLMPTSLANVAVPEDGHKAAIVRERLSEGVVVNLEQFRALDAAVKRHRMTDGIFRHRLPQRDE